MSSPLLPQGWLQLRQAPVRSERFMRTLPVAGRRSDPQADPVSHDRMRPRTPLPVAKGCSSKQKTQEDNSVNCAHDYAMLGVIILRLRCLHVC